MVDIYHFGLLKGNLSPWDKVTELKRRYDQRVQQLDNTLSENEQGAARIAESLDNTIGGQRTIENFIKSVSQERDLDNLLNSAFSMYFDYDIRDHLYFQFGGEDNSNQLEAMRKVVQLLAYGQFGSCHKCKETLNVGDMLAEGIWDDNGLLIKEPTNAELMLWAYCKCEGTTHIKAAEEHQQLYFKKFKEWEKMIK